MNTMANHSSMKAAVLATALMVMSPDALAVHDTSGSMIVDGIAIYYSIMPAEMIHNTFEVGSVEFVMHGGAPSGDHYHHVMVALFDVVSGQRISDATVRASISEVGLAPTTRTLEPMPIAGQMTYGNYFNLPRHQRYLVSLQIRMPTAERVVETTFDYEHD